MAAYRYLYMFAGLHNAANAHACVARVIYGIALVVDAGVECWPSGAPCHRSSMMEGQISV